MSNVVSLAERRESWHVAYQKGDLVVSVSSHGRLSISTKGSEETLSFCDSASFLRKINDDFDRTMGAVYKDTD